MTPRVHNVLSYSIAALVMPAAWLVAAGRTDAAATSALHVVVVACWVVHFARRALESALLHRYSKPSFPWGDAIVEYVYYWGFGGFIGWSLAGAALDSAAAVRVSGIVLFVLAEWGNHVMHRRLAALRTTGSSEKRLPRGGGFELVSCPHYAYEIGSWLGFTLLTLLPAAAVFLALVTAVLSYWAWQRHRAYHELFPPGSATPYPAARRALVPFVF